MFFCVLIFPSISIYSFLGGKCNFSEVSFFFSEFFFFFGVFMAVFIIMLLL